VKGTSEHFLRNEGRLNESTITIETIEFDSREIFHVTICYTRKALNTQWGRDDWEVGWFDKREEAEKMAIRKLREFNSLIRAAYKMPRFRGAPNGVRVRETNHK